jgi:hypothetical protein
MMRTYTRASRAAANLLLLAFLAVLLWNARNAGLGTTLIALAIAAAGIVYYGFFIASQHCPKCKESVVVPWSSYYALFFAVVMPFRVPFYCPHCAALTPFVRNGDPE